MALRDWFTGKTEPSAMGKPHRTVKDADRAGWAWADAERQRQDHGRRTPARRTRRSR